VIERRRHGGVALTGILLAAGSASRFGGGKLLAPLAGGTPIGVHALANLAACVDRVTAVVRPEDSALARLLAAHGASVTVCPYAANGMGQSLAWAIRATPLSEGWVVALADMPWVTTTTIRFIADSLRRGGELVAPSRRGVRGHPVAFSRRFYGELAGLSGDEGAKTILQTHAADLRVIETDDEGVSRDVDTPADLAR
jgi:molybdenum cofactor cytidylyltransferase